MILYSCTHMATVDVKRLTGHQESLRVVRLPMTDVGEFSPILAAENRFTVFVFITLITARSQH